MASRKLCFFNAIRKNINILHRNGFETRFGLIGVRTFLSEAYRCEDSWNKRLDAPIIKKINLDELYHAIDQKFSQEQTITAVDVDLFATAVRDDLYLDELEDLVHRLRLSSNAGQLFPSTSHSLIRIFMAEGHEDSLLRILNDRLNYGIFPDPWAANILMDTFLRKKQYLAAAKVGVQQMLQEDWEHPITLRLSLLSCIMHLLNPKPWDSLGQPPPAPEESKEEVKIRVKYLRNPHFDDHFDLVDGKHLVGKTLAVLAPHIGSSSLSQSLELLGWALYQKWDQAFDKLQTWKKDGSKLPLFKQAVLKIQEEMTASASDGEKPPSQTSFEAALLEFPTVEDDLVGDLEKEVKQAITSQEQVDIERQKNAFQEWEKFREQDLARQLMEIDRSARLKKVEETKKYLKEKEEHLYFFDNEEQWELKIEAKQPKYQQKWTGKIKKKRPVIDTYTPPEVGRTSNP